MPGSHYGRAISGDLVEGADLDTSPVLADTDDDGSWDGWIGVYGVNSTDNVLLYAEHLQSGIGIEGDERVDEQVETHTKNDAPFAMGADVNSDGTDEHSNIHIGELMGPSSTDPSKENTRDEIVPELTMEVDYHESVANTGILNSLDVAEETYQLYGMDVQYETDDELERLFIPGGVRFLSSKSLRRVGPELASDNEDFNHDSSGSAYMFLTWDGGGSGNWIDEFDWTDDPQGLASCQGSDTLCQLPVGGKMDFGTIVFHADIEVDSTAQIYDTLAAKAIIHETGHLLGAGRADDGQTIGGMPEEIYSGEALDDSPEEIGFSDPEGEQWSVMSSGWKDPVQFQPMNGDYIAFSIEELSTVEFNDIETRD